LPPSSSHFYFFVGRLGQQHERVDTMKKNAFFLLRLLMVLSSTTTTMAFVIQKTHNPHGAATCGATSTSLTMAPRFDKSTQTWVATNANEQPSAGYPPIGSLLRQGPKPYLLRVFKPDEYEQAVLKFMAIDKCTRNEAQGNMDAFLRQPNDWSYLRMESEKKGIQIDYVKLDQKQIALVIVWSTIVSYFVGRVAYSLVVEGQFWVN
jgi:hypothetical protein